MKCILKEKKEKWKSLFRRKKGKRDRLDLAWNRKNSARKAWWVFIYEKRAKCSPSEKGENVEREAEEWWMLRGAITYAGDPFTDDRKWCGEMFVDEENFNLATCKITRHRLDVRIYAPTGIGTRPPHFPGLRGNWKLLKFFLCLRTRSVQLRRKARPDRDNKTRRRKCLPPNERKVVGEFIGNKGNAIPY